jgi:uncharacterized OsmC-like protein
VTGEIETEDGVLVIRRIHVVYRLKADEAQREVIERVHAMHAQYCPVYRSLHAAIDITTELELD